MATGSHGGEAGAAETAARIVTAARRLFLEHGYRAVSTRQVADAVGVTQPALYHHFADKEALYVAVASAEIERLHRGLTAIVGRPAPLREHLREAARFLLATAAADYGRMRHDIERELGRGARTRLNAAFWSGVVTPLAGLFAAGQARGELPELAAGGVPPPTGAFLFLNAVAFWSEHQAVPPTSDLPHPPDADATAELAVRFLLDGIGRR